VLYYFSKKEQMYVELKDAATYAGVAALLG